jgi:hypothetical protein
MDRVLVPTVYVQRLNAYLAGGAVQPLLMLFDEHATVERYVHGEPPRVYRGIEQIEESLLRLPPIGGTFQVIDVHIEEDAVHARFVTHDFPYPMRGMYRFEVSASNKIARLTVAARYSRPAPGQDQT